MCYTVIKHSGYLTTLEKCTKHSPAALVLYISLVSSPVVLSQCRTRLRLFYLLSNKLKSKMIGALAPRNNLGVRNARQQVRRKDILHVSVRNTNKHTHKKKTNRIEQS